MVARWSCSALSMRFRKKLGAFGKEVFYYICADHQQLTESDQEEEWPEGESEEEEGENQEEGESEEEEGLVESEANEQEGDSEESESDPDAPQEVIPK